MHDTAEYVGTRRELRGHRALIHNEQRGLAPGKVVAQFNTVPSELGDPRCMQSPRHGGVEPLPGDLRFGWHEFDESEFLIDQPDESHVAFPTSINLQ